MLRLLSIFFKMKGTDPEPLPKRSAWSRFGADHLDGGGYVLAVVQFR